MIPIPTQICVVTGITYLYKLYKNISIDGLYHNYLILNMGRDSNFTRNLFITEVTH